MRRPEPDNGWPDLSGVQRLENLAHGRLQTALSGLLDRSQGQRLENEPPGQLLISSRLRAIEYTADAP